MGRKTAFKSYRVGERAIVVGGGMAGLSAARVLSDRFSQVVLLDRDELPDDANPRPGVPQGKHPHGLLLGGLKALEHLFPGFGDELRQAGAVAENLIAAPWAMSAIPNFIYPETTGERPKDLESRLNFQRGLDRLAVRDTAVFELLTEVRHLLKPPGLLNDPSIVSRIEEEIPSASELLFSSAE